VVVVVVRMAVAHDRSLLVRPGMAGASPGGRSTPVGVVMVNLDGTGEQHVTRCERADERQSSSAAQPGRNAVR